jgi:hypothetical protein
MSGREDELAVFVEEAAGIIYCSNNKVGIAQAMNLVGFTREEVTNMKWYQKVRRLSIKKFDAKATPPMPEVTVAVNALPSEASSLTASDSRSRRTIVSERDTRTSTSTTGERESVVSWETPQEDTTPAMASGCLTLASLRRRLPLQDVASPSVNSGNTTNITSSAVLEKNVKKKGDPRRTSKCLQRHNALLAAGKERNSKAMKCATTIIQNNLALDANDPLKKTAAEIVAAANKRFNSTINAKTAGRYVRLGMVGQSPLKRGPVGDFPIATYAALKGAYCTYLKLEQSGSKKQSNIKEMSKLVNATVNKRGFKKVKDYLARKLQKDTAHHFTAGKSNTIELRRLQWTTHYNLDIWFSTWKDTLIDLGFGRAKLPEETSVGEIVYLKDSWRGSSM